MYHGFNNNFIKAIRIWPKFLKHQKIYLFIFNIKDYELICNMYFRY